MKDERKIEDFSKLIPELSKWNDGKGIDIEDWIRGIGNYEHAIAYGQLFWQKFIEYDNCILRVEQVDIKNYWKWKLSTLNNKMELEKVVNHLHVRDLFPNTDEPSKEILSYFSNLLKEIWSCKLKMDFPNKNIIVEVYGEETDEFYDPQITIYQAR